MFTDLSCTKTTSIPRYNYNDLVELRPQNSLIATHVTSIVGTKVRFHTKEIHRSRYTGTNLLHHRAFTPVMEEKNRFSRHQSHNITLYDMFCH